MEMELGHEEMVWVAAPPGGTATTASRDRYHSSTLAKALALLELFDAERPDLSLTEMAEAMNTRAGSIYPLVSTLTRYGYLQRDPDTKRYRLGLRFLTQASRILAALDIRELAKPVLKKVARELGVSAHLGVMYEDEVLYLDREEAAPGVVSASAVGRRVPAHCTALGKVFLACDEQAVERLLSSGDLPAVTVYTITDPEELRGQLAEVRRRGYAVDMEEFHEGNVCVGAPIRNHEGVVAGGLSVSLGRARLERDALEVYVEAVLSAAAEVSEALGYSSGSEEGSGDGGS